MDTHTHTHTHTHRLVCRCYFSGEPWLTHVVTMGLLLPSFLLMRLQILVQVCPAHLCNLPSEHNPCTGKNQSCLLKTRLGCSFFVVVVFIFSSFWPELYLSRSMTISILFVMSLMQWSFKNYLRNLQKRRNYAQYNCEVVSVLFLL